MRWIAKILSVVTILLTLLPCSDGFAQSQKHDVAHITISTEDTQDHHSDDGDLCSPFCTCVCCASLVYIEKSFNVAQSEPMCQVVQKHFVSDLTSGFISRNFQPPRA